MGPRRLLRARRLRARQPGKALLRRYRRLTAWLWRHRLQVPAVHNKFRRRWIMKATLLPLLVTETVIQCSDPVTRVDLAMVTFALGKVLSPVRSLKSF